MWRVDDDGKAFSLKILKAGRVLATAASDKTVVDAPILATATGIGEARGVGLSGETDQQVAPDRPRSGAKRALILALMRREGGATMIELTSATGWLPHTMRAALTGLRKGGITVELAKGQRGAASTYRVEMPAAAAA